MGQEIRQLAYLVFGHEASESEFESEPFAYTFECDAGRKEGKFVHWYEGLPEYVGDHDGNLPKYGKPDPVYRTVVCDCTWGSPQETVTDEEGRTWERKQEFAVSPERACPCHTDSGNDAETVASIQSWIDKDHGGRCPYCEEAAGKEHGFVYLGEGWHECVYQQVPTPQELAEANNIEWWTEEAYEVTCKCGVYLVSERSGVPFPGIDCPSCGEDVPQEDVKATGETKWWWWTCCGGCLPDSDVHGPYDTEAACLADASEGLTD